MKKVTAIIAVLLIVCSMLSACSQSGEGNTPSLFGKWVYTIDDVDITYSFNSDGTGSISTMGGMINVSFAYQLNNGEITFHEVGNTVMGEKPYSYTIKDDTLTLTNSEETLTLTKK